jgi:hypothetical protein
MEINLSLASKIPEKAAYVEILVAEACGGKSGGAFQIPAWNETPLQCQRATVEGKHGKKLEGAVPFAAKGEATARLPKEEQKNGGKSPAHFGLRLAIIPR